jgi:hypothetical protein
MIQFPGRPCKMKVGPGNEATVQPHLEKAKMNLGLDARGSNWLLQ